MKCQKRFGLLQFSRFRKEYPHALRDYLVKNNDSIDSYFKDDLVFCNLKTKEVLWIFAGSVLKEGVQLTIKTLMDIIESAVDSCE